MLIMAVIAAGACVTSLAAGLAVRAWLARNPTATGLTYGYVLYAVTAP